MAYQSKTLPTVRMLNPDGETVIANKSDVDDLRKIGYRLPSDPVEPAEPIDEAPEPRRRGRPPKNRDL